jgi:hypothetical protein
VDKKFEDLLEGPDYTTRYLSETRVAKYYRSAKYITGLGIMYLDIIFREKLLGHEHEGFKSYLDPIIPSDIADYPGQRYVDDRPRKWSK